MGAYGDIAHATARRFRIVSVVGTRPEAIKMAPVARALAAVSAVNQLILLTNQHQGLAPAFPGHVLHNLGGAVAHLPIAAQRDRLQAGIAAFLHDHRPDLVLVQGDTTSALAGALAARECGIALCHVEAGLRSHKHEPWPEEENRVAIDAMAALLLAPTPRAAANLALDPRVWGAVHVTGNTGIDALFSAASRLSPSVQPQGPRKRILVTCHRRENQHAAFLPICTGLRRLVRELPVELCYLLHTNPHLQAAAREQLGGIDHIELRAPATHFEMVRLMRSCWALLTDSGGLQEDGAALGIPVLVLREVTERVEAPANIRLVGRDPERILAGVNRILLDATDYAAMTRPSLAFGDGHAAARIAAHVEAWLHAHAAKPQDAVQAEASATPSIESELP